MKGARYRMIDSAIDKAVLAGDWKRVLQLAQAGSTDEGEGLVVAWLASEAYCSPQNPPEIKTPISFGVELAAEGLAMLEAMEMSVSSRKWQAIEPHDS
jgi:hypothetical protein